MFPVNDLKTMIRLFAPIASLLEKDLGVKVDLLTAVKRDDFNRRTEEGHYDLVWTCPACYIKVHETAGIYAIARGVPPFKGIVMVRKDSGIGSIEDLKGKRIAAANPYSIAGYLFLRNELSKIGIFPPKDVTFDFFGFSESIPFKVYNKTYDAGVLSEDTLAMSTIMDSVMDDLKIILTSSSIPQLVFAVKKDMNSELVNKIQNCLVSIDENTSDFSEILKELRLERIERADDSSYDNFRILYMETRNFVNKGNS